MARRVGVRAHPRRGTRGVRRHVRVLMHQSPLHGFGTFAVTDIPEGSNIPLVDINGIDVVFNSGRPEHGTVEEYNEWARRQERMRAWTRYMDWARANDLPDATYTIRIDPNTPRANVVPPAISGGRTWRARRLIRSGEELLVSHGD